MNERIQCLVNLFPRGNILVDIGSDHGYLGLELLKSSKVCQVWNVDVSKSALKDSERIYKKHKMSDKAVFICSDGFRQLKNIPENAVVVIAGLGSSQILRILEFMPDNVNNLVLLSHTDYLPIRRWSIKNSWIILKEKYVEDRGYHYMAMYLIKGRIQEEYSLEEFIFGKKFFRDGCMDIFSRYWKEKSTRILKIPEKYRTLEEKTAIRFLIEENILSGRYLNEKL